MTEVVAMKWRTELIAPDGQYLDFCLAKDTQEIIIVYSDYADFHTRRKLAFSFDMEDDLIMYDVTDVAKKKIGRELRSALWPKFDAFWFSLGWLTNKNVTLDVASTIKRRELSFTCNSGAVQLLADVLRTDVRSGFTRSDVYAIAEFLEKDVHSDVCGSPNAFLSQFVSMAIDRLCNGGPREDVICDIENISKDLSKMSACDGISEKICESLQNIDWMRIKIPPHILASVKDKDASSIALVAFHCLFFTMTTFVLMSFTHISAAHPDWTITQMSKAPTLEYMSGHWNSFWICEAVIVVFCIAICKLACWSHLRDARRATLKLMAQGKYRNY
jgi:hypothetical protein